MCRSSFDHFCSVGGGELAFILRKNEDVESVALACGGLDEVLMPQCEGVAVHYHSTRDAIGACDGEGV